MRVILAPTYLVYFEGTQAHTHLGNAPLSPHFLSNFITLQSCVSACPSFRRVSCVFHLRKCNDEERLRF